LTVSDVAREGGAVVSARPFGANRVEFPVHDALRFDAFTAALARHLSKLKALRGKNQVNVRTGTVDTRKNLTGWQMVLQTSR
jgi:hypothetical protein